MNLSLLFTSAISSAVTENETDVPRIRMGLEDESFITEQESENLKTCAQNLIAIGKALQTHKKEHGDFPEWLSELHPKYLANPDTLICPADEEQGVPILSYNTDPNLPVSYNYDCDPEYYQQWLKHERHVYNSANPLVRCPHHANPDSDSTLVSNLHLNLSFSNNVYLSDAFWHKHPIKMYGSLQAAIAGYERALQLVPDDPHFFLFYPELLRLYTEAKQEKDVENIIKSFKSVMKPHGEDIMRFRDYWTLVEMLKIVGKHEEALQLLQHLEKTEQENLFIRSIFREIAMIHEEKGNTELAKAYSLKADPKLDLIGKPAPDFSLTDINGNPISLKDYQGKVVLLDFWATWCGPCIAEMPNVKKIYDTHKDRGFVVIGISLDNDASEVRDFLKECELPWRQICDGQDGTLKKLFQIRGIPSLWLIDREGKVISYKTRGAELRILVDETVKAEI